MSERPTLEQVNGIMRMSIPLVATTRIEVVELEAGYARATAPFEGNGNHLGTMYAGVLFSVAELLGGAMAASTFDIMRYAPVVKNVDIAFKRPAKTDVFAEARLDDATIAAAIEAADTQGKGPYELLATVTDTNGDIVATTVGQYQIRPHS